LSDDRFDGDNLPARIEDALSPAASRFLGTMLGSPSYELSEIVAEQFRSWRLKRQIVHLQKAIRQMEEAGMTPGAVPIRVLAPLLDAASLEDDDSMQERWASLLANAAGGRLEVPPSFASVLRELEPVEAQMLDVVYAHLLVIAPELRHEFGIGRPTFAPTEESDYFFHVDNLSRLRLLHAIGAYGERKRSYDRVGITAFGQAFVRACKPPSEPAPRIRWTSRDALVRHIEQCDTGTDYEEDGKEIDVDPSPIQPLD
jgi:hypothetical protein